jgi:hypothetical protein
LCRPHKAQSLNISFIYIILQHIICRSITKYPLKSATLACSSPYTNIDFAHQIFDPIFNFYSNTGILFKVKLNSLSLSLTDPTDLGQCSHCIGIQQKTINLTCVASPLRERLFTCSVMVVVIARSVDNQGVWSTLSGQTKDYKNSIYCFSSNFLQIKNKDLLGRSQIKWPTGANMVYMRTDVLSKLAVHYENSAQCYCFKANIIISSNSDYFSPQYSWKSCRFRGKKTPPPVFFFIKCSR